LKEEIEEEEVMKLIKQVAKKNEMIKMLTKQYNMLKNLNEIKKGNRKKMNRENI